MPQAERALWEVRHRGGSQSEDRGREELRHDDDKARQRSTGEDRVKVQAGCDALQLSDLNARELPGARSVIAAMKG